MPKSKEVIEFEKKFCKQHKGRTCSMPQPCRYFKQGHCVEWEKVLDKMIKSRRVKK
jgi:hypothetical protein